MIKQIKKIPNYLLKVIQLKISLFNQYQWLVDRENLYWKMNLYFKSQIKVVKRANKIHFWIIKCREIILFRDQKEEKSNLACFNQEIRLFDHNFLKTLRENPKLSQKRHPKRVIFQKNCQLKHKRPHKKPTRLLTH